MRSETCVCMLVHGVDGYYRAAQEAIGSVLDLTPFDIFVAGADLKRMDLPWTRRLRLREVEVPGPEEHRARRFLAKFLALDACLREVRAEHLLMMDADALFVRPVADGEVPALLASCPLAMVEQTCIRGSPMRRPQLREHYLRHSHAFLAPGNPEPPLEGFRFYNSGVVLGRRGELEDFLTWALAQARGREHQVGEHMIADQDYFQVWVNALRVGACRDLPWHWNHCQHWDEGFPRPDATVIQFSNFCLGPDAETPARMRDLRGRAAAALPAGRRWENRLRGLASRLLGVVSR